MIELTDTTASAIASAFVKDRLKAGSPAMGMVLTLIVVVDEEHADQAMTSARMAAHEHPARSLGVILGDARGASHVHAQVGTLAGWTGETALIRLRGEVVKHADSVVLPLLLPDSPVAIWWATQRTARPRRRPARLPGPAAHHRRLGRHAGQAAGHAHAVLVVLPRQHRPGLDEADALAGAARLGPRPVRDRRHLGVGHRRADQPERGPARDVARRPPQGEGVPPQLEGPGDHRGGARDQAGPDPDQPASTASWPPSPPPTGPTGRSRSSAWACPRCWPRSCVGSTRTTCTPAWPARSRRSGCRDRRPRPGPLLGSRSTSTPPTWRRPRRAS